MRETPKVIALAGNPNTGKSTVFNSLTGLKQHTGNWPGKTVTLARGSYVWKGSRYTIVDLPGTYSLLANSPDEEVTRDFICFERPDATVVVADATCLERDLNLILQVIEATPRVVVCLNLMDEARKHMVQIDTGLLSSELGVPVVPCAARQGQGLGQLRDSIASVAGGEISLSPRRLRYGEEIERSIQAILPSLFAFRQILEPRWLALRLLDQDEAVLRQVAERVFEPQIANRAIATPKKGDASSWAGWNQE